MKPAASRLLHALAIAVFATMVLLAPATTSAQEARGTITGKILDTNKSVLAGATVKVTNVAMGTTLTLRTNEDGFYQAPYLIPGSYQVVVEATGFKRYVRDGILVRVNDNIQIDIELEIGSLDQTVTVTADAPLLDTSSASMGAVVDSRRVAELPIPHGEPFKLIGLAGGVSYTMDPRLDRPFEPTHIVGYAINGTRANRSDITIDGVPSTSTADGNQVIASFVPPQDLIQEFKVQTATFDAAFGNTEGGVTNLSIKSGANSFHGTIGYSKMPGSLMANDFFGNSTNTPLPDFTYTRWGGTVGGPVLIPKLYNGRNKTFFMYGIEGIPEARPRNNGVFNIPSAAMANGNFTELLAASSGYQLFNPFSSRREVQPNGTVRFRRDAFRCGADGNPLPLLAGTKVQSQDSTLGSICNKIPDGLIDPVARNFVNNFLPDPTSTGAADGSGNFQQPGLTERIEYLSNTIRIDHVLSEKHRIFGRASWYNRDSNYNNYFGNAATGEEFLFKSRQGALDHVWLVSPTIVINSRYGYNRFIRGTDSNPENRGFDLTSLGFTADYNNLIPDDIRRFPRFDIGGYQGTGVNGELRPTDTHAVISTVNHTVGAHGLKYGVEFRSYRETDRFFRNNQTGQFNFDAKWTRGPLDNSTIPIANTPLGFSFAAFLLGLPTSATIDQPADYAEQSTTTGLFIQDDWKVNSRLTINLGLRYEVEGALTDRFNRSVSGFDFNAVQAIEAAARAKYALNPTPEVPVDQFNIRGGLLFPGVNGAGRGLYETPKKNFMPRFGFAYKLTDKTVIRGGYGIFFGFLGQRRGDVNQLGFNTNTNTNLVTDDNGLPVGGQLLSQSFQGKALNVAQGAAGGIQTFLGQNITFFNQNPLSPYNQRYELSFQRELPGGWVAEAAYVGNRGTHIEITRNLNVIPQRFLSTSLTRDQATIDYLSAPIRNPFISTDGTRLLPSNAISDLSGTDVARNRLLRPFSQFNEVNTTTNEGYSWYHSLQLNMNKRFSQGYTLGANYTFSKFMQATEFLNQDDPRPNEIISDADRPHRFSLSGIYELPFGKGRKFFADNKVASYFIGGWQISTVYQFQSGAPLTAWGNFVYLGDISDIKLSGDEQSLNSWFNTTGFVAARTGPAANSIFRDTNNQVVWLDFNDPCKNRYNTTTCPGTPLANPVGFNRDGSLQLDNNARTFPQRFSFLRADQINNIDFSLIKKTEILENKNIEFRAEFLNGFNHPLFPLGNGTTTGVITSPTSSSFGRVVASTQANYQRRVQLTLKFVF